MFLLTKYVMALSDDEPVPLSPRCASPALLFKTQQQCRVYDAFGSLD